MTARESERERKCPKCGGDVFLADDVVEYDLDPGDYEDGEDAEVWVCYDCDWNEEATPEEALEEHVRHLEWLGEMLARIQT